MHVLQKELINYININMQKDDTTKDLDDFWIELMDKSEWAKNEAYKNPNEFRNLNILGVKKNTKIHVPEEDNFQESNIKHPDKIVSKRDKITSFLNITFVVLVVVLLFIIFLYFFVNYFNFSEVKVWLDNINNFKFKSS